MCGICGCDGESHLPKKYEQIDQGDILSIDAHEHIDNHLIEIEQDVFSRNNQFALLNRNYFRTQTILALNLMSSPGAGKTTLLVNTITALQNRFKIAAIEGDQQTDLDAQRIKAAGATVIQVNTGRSCHLDAHMIGHAAEKLPINSSAILFIENVGNLVCPALFDLGETSRIVILSVTEGEDKPIKYPEMFRVADLLILNKIDLLPYLKFDVNQCMNYAHRINPDIKILKLSATSGEGLGDWYRWLEDNYASL